MKIFFTNQQAHLIRLLPAFKALPLSYDAQTVLREKATSVMIPSSAAVTELSSYNFDSLFAYDIFPSRIMSFAAEWQSQGRTMQEGDVIVQQAFLPPLLLSMKCVFAVRVLQIFREPTKVGFSYGTLKGHAETGRSEFSFALHDGVIRATIHTYSFPGILLTRLVAPLVTLPYQRYCTHLGLQRMREAFLAANRAHVC
jgi:uncharacterized protein (UPF0548 family)